MPNSKFDMQKILKVAKRIAITVLICIPFLFAFAYLTRKVITSNGLQIFSFIVILLVVVGIEELIARKIEKNKKSKPKVEDNKTDVDRKSVV